MSRSYQAALDWLFPRTTQIKFGLETTRALLEALGHPERQFESIHIGGTNGKGSTANLVADALSLRGLRTGLYTSPHLISFRERIVVDRVPISEAAVVAWLDQMRPVIEETGATFFEVTTALAFAHFAARGVDIAVVEVGLGGRLDSTNVLTPLVSCVTHVAIDHQRYLGESIEEIAREKAGIAKPGVPFVIGEGDSYRADLLATSAMEQSSGAADVIVVPGEQLWQGTLALSGPHQRRNAAVASEILDALPDPIRPDDATRAEAFATTTLPGRLERRGKWLYDVAHNPDGMLTLTTALREMQPPRPIHALVSILGDKDWPAMLVELDREIDYGVLTVAPTAVARGWDLEWLSRWLADPNRPPARARWHLEPDFERALVQVERGAGTVLVTGSFHTVGDAQAARGISLV